jgi:hypothetical protein
MTSAGFLPLGVIIAVGLDPTRLTALRPLFHASATDKDGRTHLAGLTLRLRGEVHDPRHLSRYARHSSRFLSRFGWRLRTRTVVFILWLLLSVTWGAKDLETAFAWIIYPTSLEETKSSGTNFKSLAYNSCNLSFPAGRYCTERPTPMDLVYESRLLIFAQALGSERGVDLRST